MIDLDHSIRLHQGADFERDHPEPKTGAWLWPLMIAGICIVAGAGYPIRMLTS